MQTIRKIVFSSLKHVPGPFTARLSNLKLSIAGIQGRRVYVSGLSPYCTPPSLNEQQALDALHNKYGDVVRVGPNEVSVASWRDLRTIYANTKTVVKDPAFYANATFVGKNNIFQMTYAMVPPQIK